MNNFHLPIAASALSLPGRLPGIERRRSQAHWDLALAPEQQSATWLRGVRAWAGGRLRADQPEALPNGIGVQPCRAANKREVIFIVEEEIFSPLLVPGRPAYPIGDGAVNHSLPELLL